jgi:hypothetical protein
VFKCVHEADGGQEGSCVRMGNLVELKMAFADLARGVVSSEPEQSSGSSELLDDELLAAIKRQLPFETMNYGRKKRQLPFETLNYGKRSASSLCDCSRLGQLVSSYKRNDISLPFDMPLYGKRGLPFETLNYGKRARKLSKDEKMPVDGYIMGKREE